MSAAPAHILIARTCVNDCIFCAVAAKRRAGVFPTKAEVTDFIRKIADQGWRHLVFSGLGEPTLDPNFETYLCLAGDSGFTQICLFTNGHGLTLEKARRWRENGLTQVLLSLHGIEDDHDNNVQRKGSFREAASALRSYADLGLKITINTCLTRRNLDGIPQLRTFLKPYPVAVHTLSFPEWSGNVRLFESDMVAYEEVATMADRLISPGDPSTLFDNIPCCLVGKRIRKLQAGPSIRLLDNKGDHVLQKSGVKIYPRVCAKRGCPHREGCPGFEKNYIAARGWRGLLMRVNRFLDTVRDTSASAPAAQPLPRYLSVPGPAADEHRNDLPGAGRQLLVVVKATYRCNAACRYCCSQHEPANPFLTLDGLAQLYAAVFDYAQSAGFGCINFLWHGGEPLLLGKSFFARAWEASFRQTGLRVEHRVQTNLLLLDPEWTDLLRTYRVRLGTSVDPIGKDRVHKNGRLQYPDWLEKFTLACEENLPVGVVFTVTSAHLDHAVLIYNYFKNLQVLSPKPVAVRINPVSAVGKASAMLDPDQIVKPAAFGDFLYRLWEQWNDDGRSLALSPLREWAERKGLSCEFSGSCHEYVLSFDADGAVYHCGRFADTGPALGKLWKDKLTEILLHPRRRELQKRSEILQAGWCNRCRFWTYCKGGCPYHADVHSGDSLQPSPLCRGYRRFFEKSGLGGTAASRKGYIHD